MKKACFLGLALLSAVSFAKCRVHAIDYIDGKGTPSKDLSHKEVIEDSIRDIQGEFAIVLSSLCEGKTCGVDAIRDQKARDRINGWVKKVEALAPEKVELLKHTVKVWLYKQLGNVKTIPELYKTERKEKLRFFEARLKEKKSALQDLFCLE